MTMLNYYFFLSTEHKMRSDKSQNIEFYTEQYQTPKKCFEQEAFFASVYHLDLLRLVSSYYLNLHTQTSIFGLRFFTLLFNSLRLKCFARVTKNKMKLFDENWRWFRISCSQRTKHNVTTKWRAIIIHFSCESICLSLVRTLFCV